MAGEIIGRYHLFRRKYRNTDGKVHTYWWYWWNEGDKRKQKPAGRACSKKVEAREFLEERIRQDALESKDALNRSLPGRSTCFTEFAAMLFVPGARHLRRDAELSSPIKDDTRDAHRGRIQNYLVPRWGAFPLSYFEIDGFESEFTDWLLDLEKVPRKVRDGTVIAPPAPLSNSLKNNIVETMGLVLAEAKRQRFVTKLPEFERFQRKSRRQDTLTVEELHLLFPDNPKALERIWSIDDSRDVPGTGIMFGAAFCLAVSAGLRSGEVRAVHRDQIISKKVPGIGLVHGLIVDQAYDGDMLLGMLKKGTEEDPRYRAVLLPDRTMQILGLWLEHAPPTGPIFQYHGHPLNKDHFLSRWSAGLARAGIDVEGKRLTVHALRYTFNTRMRPLLSAEVLLAFTGHRSEDMTDLYDRPHLESRLMQLAGNQELVDKFWE